MKRKLMGSLLAVILISVLSTALLISTHARGTIREILEDQKAALRTRIRNKLVAFDKLLFVFEKEMNDHGTAAIRRIADRLTADGGVRTDIPRETLRDLARETGVHEIYLIGRDGVIVETTFAPDLGFNLFETDDRFKVFLQSLFGAGRVAHQRITLSNNTGTMNLYIYYSPPGADHLIEISLRLKDYLREAYSAEYHDFLLHDFFTDLVDRRGYVEQIDLFTQTKVSGWSLIHEGRPVRLDPDLAARLTREDRVILDAEGRSVLYARIHLENLLDGFTENLFVRAVFDFGVLQRFARRSLVYTGAICVFLVALLFWIFSGLIRSRILRPILRINNGLKRVEEGDYSVPLSGGGQDELARIAENVGKMAEKIRDRERALRVSEENYRSLNAALEQRVEERTGQLKKTNQHLEKAMSEAQRLARKTENADRAKSEFLAKMSHEIRTPMNGIIGACDLMIGTEMNRRQREYVNIIRTSARSLLGLLNDILDLSKIEAGKLEFERIPFSPWEVIEEVCDVFFDKIGEKETELIVDIEPEVPAWIVGDPFRLRQVLTNLISNAFKFTEKGEIAISLAPRETGEDFIELLCTVKDDGEGIPDHIRSRLFDSFVQADDSITRRYGGTGLGLAICKQIVGLMGGEIWVESHPGKGTVFSFTARFEPSPEGAAGDRGAETPLQGLNILVVEDNHATQQVLRKLLGSFGCRTLAVESAETLMEIYGSRSTRPGHDIILIDYKLPGMDGISAAERLKAEMGSSAPPMVIISGYIGESDIERVKAAGIESYLTKPIKAALLRDTILEIFGHPVHSSPSGADSLSGGVSMPDLRMLVVEDNLTNQRVMSELLKSAGIRVETAADGFEAVDAVRRNDYDAVLMDVQMPEMDGMEATRIIRSDLGKRSLPIIAMTAYAMSGDRERCLGAGMSGYISKPIDRKELFAALRKHLSGLEAESPPTETAAPPPASASDLPGIDLDSGLERIGGDPALYLEILESFLREQEGFMEEFLRIADQDGLAAAARRAHALKGAAGNISANHLKALVHSLEDSCLKGDSDPLPGLLEEVREAFDEVRRSSAALARHHSGGGPRPARGHLRGPSDRNLPPLLTVLEDLQKALGESDPVASARALETLTSCYQLDGLDAPLTRLGDRIAGYDFDGARSALMEILNALKSAVPESRCSRAFHRT